MRGLRVAPPERAVLDGVAVLDPAAAGRLVDRALLARAAWRAGLRALLVNQRVLDHVVDLYEPELRLVVEVDGYRFHSSRDAFHHDRVRQNALVAAGHTVLRFTAEQVLTDATAVAAEIAAVADRLRRRA